MKAPSFQFYPADWLSSQRVQMMTLEEEGAYIRLLCYCWSHGSIPSDPVQIERLLGKKVSTNVVTNVQRMFKVRCNEDSALTHERLELERERQRERRLQTAEAGRKSAEKRKKATKPQRESNERCNERSNSVETDVGKTLQRKSNPSSSSSTSVGEEDISRGDLPPAVGEPPVSLEAVVQNCGQFGVLPKVAERWWLTRDGQGWNIKGRWQSNLRSYALTWQDNEEKQRHQTARPDGVGERSRPETPEEKRQAEEQHRETERVNHEMTEEMKEAGRRMLANGAWERADPATRGPKPYPKTWETDMLMEVAN